MMQLHLLEQLIPDGKEYLHHCAWHGAIYKDEIGSEELFNVNAWKNVKRGFPEELDRYKITSGICMDCFYKFREEYKVEKNE